jgi:hypothetical protein
MNGRPWKIGDRVRLRSGAPQFPLLGAGTFLVVELGDKWVRVRRYERAWKIQKSDLIRMGKGM